MREKSFCEKKSMQILKHALSKRERKREREECEITHRKNSKPRGYDAM